MSATHVRPTDAVLPRPRRRLGIMAWSLIVAVVVAGSIALTIVLSDSGGAASEKAGHTVERPAHAPGPNGELRPT